MVEAAVHSGTCNARLRWCEVERYLRIRAVFAVGDVLEQSLSFDLEPVDAESQRMVLEPVLDSEFWRFYTKRTSVLYL